MSEIKKTVYSLKFFPSVFVSQDETGAFRFVISEWRVTGWWEVLESKIGYLNWLDAHSAGAEAMVRLVMQDPGSGPLALTSVKDFQDTAVDSAVQTISRQD